MKIIVIVLIILNSWVFAVNTGYRHIQSMGCHMNDGTCYVTISGDAVGFDGCKSRSVRWSKDSHNGKETLSLLQTVFISGKEVSFNISKCYPNQSHYPTFNYINIR